MLAPAPTDAVTLPHWIGHRATQHGQRTAATFVNDDGEAISWTYEELWRRSCAVAASLPKTDEKSPRALLLFPPGLEFLSAFLGCQIANWIPVPTCYPKPKREMPRLDSAANDCRPSAILSDGLTLDLLDADKLCPVARDVPRLAVDRQPESDLIDAETLQIDPESLALLQYTSGSTSEPKGVMVRHRNLMANLESIRLGFNIQWQPDDATEFDTGVFWLPFFHDMGLIGGLLEPLYVGGHTVLISPRAFLQRPIRWLQCISDYHAVISGAPNFAYQLCVDRIAPEQTDTLDLSRWRVAFSGAEPILPRTLRDFTNRFADCGFSSSAFYPCYGLAEATLLAAGGDGPAEPKVLSVDRESLGQGNAKPTSNADSNATHELICCGHPANETELLIVDPIHCTPQAENQVGEIWLRGKSVTKGYWNRDEENESQFNAMLNSGESGFCRTGDLGFLHDGELYVTGRSKDVIILRGRNLFPQDIETTVSETVGSEGGMTVAFPVMGPRSESLAIIAELPRRIDSAKLSELARDIRRAVIETHEVDPRHVCLVRQATVPLTSSGKVQRNRCREMFDSDEIKCKYRYDRSSAAEQAPIELPSLPPEPTIDDRDSIIASIESWMTQWLVARAGVQPDDIDLDKPFAEYGLDSMTAVELSGETEDWSGVELTPVVAWNHPTVSRMSSYIGDSLLGIDESDDVPKESADELENLLDELSQLSDDEIDQALADEQKP
ncbi:MAG: AMP-binding protein [Pirellulaceae bacterium]|nr:AMP-binding protein [Pirellulaceae bacterium]